jgi:hypothetical protein
VRGADTQRAQIIEMAKAKTWYYDQYNALSKDWSDVEKSLNDNELLQLTMTSAIKEGSSTTDNTNIFLFGIFVVVTLCAIMGVCTCYICRRRRWAKVEKNRRIVGTHDVA